MELFASLDRTSKMSNLSPPSRAPAQPASLLDHQGGLSLWLRAGIFALALLALLRPDRWAWSLPSLHDVFLWLFAYSIVGDLVGGVFAVIAAIAIFVAVVVLLCFDRIVYVPAYRIARSRFRLSALAAFSMAVVIEGLAGGGTILAVRHRIRSIDGAGSTPMTVLRHTQPHTGARHGR
jgi:uncharacterized membrane protein YciS (DUF1049 family)